ncbi:MAG: thioredoxin family protein [Bacteroidia bacterium]
MNKQLLIIFFFISFKGLLSAQNVTISGSANWYKYNEISVWTTLDYISNAQKKLTYTTIDSGGNFLLELNTNAIQYITLKIEKHIASMYIEPNQHYELIVQPPDSTTYQNPNIEHDVKIEIKLKSKTEINALTMDYDKRFDNFLSFDYPYFVSRGARPKIDSFNLVLQSYYSTVKNDYFHAYINYTIATIEEKIGESQKKLFNNYINQKPILYNHVEYMNFFNTFFKGKLQAISNLKSGSSLNFQINDRGSYIGTMNTLKQDTLLKNDTLRELVLLKGLYESYYEGSFQKSSIIAILQQITQESKIEKHIEIAYNILNSFSKLKPGADAPGFELPNKMGLTSNLDELRAKNYIYLLFFNVNCSACIEQMKVIPSLKKKYGKNITFVAISVDKTFEDFKKFCNKNLKYDWVFLYDNTNGALKKSYEIKSLPTYFLINTDGKFIQVPADSPDQDIDRAFYDITKPKTKTHNVGSKENNY